MLDAHLFAKGIQFYVDLDLQLFMIVILFVLQLTNEVHKERLAVVSSLYISHFIAYELIQMYIYVLYFYIYECVKREIVCP